MIPGASTTGAGSASGFADLQLVHRASVANVHGPPLNRMSANAEQQNATDKRNGARSTGLVMSFRTFFQHQDKRLVAQFEECERHASDPLYPTDKYESKSRRNFDLANRYFIDNVSGDLYEVSNGSSSNPETQLVDVGTAPAGDVTCVQEITIGGPRTSSEFKTKGLWCPFTIAVARTLSTALPPPCWWRLATVMRVCFGNVKPLPTLVPLGELARSHTLTGAADAVLSTRNAGRPRQHRRFASPAYGERPGDNGTAPRPRGGAAANQTPSTAGTPAAL
jgi:hypothetical protein